MLLFAGIFLICNSATIRRQSPASDGTVFADTTIAGGNWGGGYYEGSGTWTLDDDGLLTISGSGSMGVDPINNKWWNTSAYRTSIKSVDIRDGITSIGNDAFFGCTSLEEITIPSSVISVGDRAYNSCDLLQYNTYQNGKYLGNDANPYHVFAEVIDKTQSTMNLNINTRVIGDLAFNGCSALNSITIPSGVTGISYKAFKNCNSLTSIIIPDSVTSIMNDAFHGCSSLQYNTYQNGKYLGNDTNPYHVFVGVIDKTQSTINLNSNTGIILYKAFSECASLEEITIPSGVVSIGNRAFEDCASLGEVIIPGSVTVVGQFAFYECRMLHTIKFKGEYPPEIGLYSFFMFYDWDNDDDGFDDDVSPSNTQILVPEEYEANYTENSFWLSSYAFDGYSDYCLVDFVHTYKLSDSGDTGVIADIVLPSVIITTLCAALMYVTISGKKKRI